MVSHDDRFYESSDGLSLHYLDYNRAETEAQTNSVPVICLPGLTRNSRDFRAIAEHIAVGRRVLALDFRGRGRSAHDPVADNYVPPTYANDVLSLLDGLQIEKVISLGTSLGGIVTMLLAAMAPDRIHAAILNDVGAVVDPAGLARISSYAGLQGPVASWSEAVGQARATNEIAFPGKSDDWWLAFAHNIFREDGDGTPVLDYDPKIGEAMRSAGGTPDPDAGWVLFEALKSIPTLLIRGELSDILSREVTADMKLRKPDLVVVEATGVGHAPTLEECDAVEAIDGFLASDPVQPSC